MPHRAEGLVLCGHMLEGRICGLYMGHGCKHCDGSVEWDSEGAEAPWIQSFSGKVAEPLSLSKDCVDIETIAHALSNKCRFNGHTQSFYSVAQHCVLGAQLIETTYKLPFLLHEVSEVFLPDIPAPIKPYVRVEIPRICDDIWAWGKLEAQHADVIFEALGLSSIRALIDSKEVKAMDLAMLAWEKRDLMGPEPKPWKLKAEPAAAYPMPEAWNPPLAKEHFLNLYNQLRRA